MSQNKLPKQSKIIVTFVGFLVTIYLLFIGFSYLKSWNDFKPYHKLAVELNQKQGGNFAITEKKQADCQAFESSCPYVELNKNDLSLDLMSARKQKNSIKNFFTSKGFIVGEDQDCLLVKNDISFCGFQASNGKSKQTTVVGVGENKISISVFKQ